MLATCLSAFPTFKSYTMVPFWKPGAYAALDEVGEEVVFQFPPQVQGKLAAPVDAERRRQRASQR